MDDLKKTKVIQLMDLKDLWLIRQNKITLVLKAKMKKIKVIEVKKKVK